MNERWQEIERIYHAVRELDKNARAPFLATARGEDEDLPREAESLLVHESQAERLLEYPTVAMAAHVFGVDG